VTLCVVKNAFSISRYCGSIPVEFLWIVTPCIIEIGNQLFEGGDSKNLRNVGILLQNYTLTQPGRWRQHGTLKRWHPTTTLHGVRTLNMEATRTSEKLVFYHNTTRLRNPEDGGSMDL
jgi:hypothetical protein